MTYLEKLFNRWLEDDEPMPRILLDNFDQLDLRSPNLKFPKNERTNK